MKSIEKDEQIKKEIDADPEFKQIIDEFSNFAHALQSAIKYKVHNDFKSQDLVDQLKHIRVGVDMSMAQIDALTELLIDNKVFTRKEFCKAVNMGLRLKLNQYKEELQNALGIKNIEFH